MKLLHGSNMVIDKPLLEKCKSNNDFGRGFYLTNMWQRAWTMGKRRVSFYGGEISVSSFHYYPSICKKKGLYIKEFRGFTTEWARFILNNRNNPGFTHDYDIVIGPVADAFLDREIDLYKKRFGEAYMDDQNLRDHFIPRINNFKDDYIQYCFCTQRAIDELIKG